MTVGSRLVAVLIGASAALAGAGPAAAAIPGAGPPPGSMASLGDSITRGFNACGYYFDCTSRSWSTGSSSYVNSHYRRILAKNPAIRGRNYNCAERGAVMADLNGQAGCAVGRNVAYLTILMGANDACTPDEASMTPVATYRARLDQALATLKSGLPNARVFVSSIPNVYRLWEVLHRNGFALAAWDAAKICQSMLADAWSYSSGDEARRRRVRQRLIDYNAQLAQACARYGPQCDYDSNVVFDYPFRASLVSAWDYFHPNSAGQAVLARETYANGFAW